MAALVVDSGSGLVAMLVFLVMLLLALCEFPGILAGVDQKDSGALIVGSCSYMCKARIAGFTARCVFPLVVGRPAGRLLWTRSTFTQLAGFTGDDVPRAVLPFVVVRPKMLGIMAGMTRGVQKIWFLWKMTSYVSVFGSLVRQWMHIDVSLQRPGLRLQKTAESRSCSSSLVIDIFFTLRRLIPMVQTN